MASTHRPTEESRLTDPGQGLAEAASGAPVSRAERRSPTDWVLFGVAAGITLAFVLWGAISTDSLASISSTALDWVKHNVGWAFVLAASGFVVYTLWLAFGRFGRIPLGRDDELPEFRTVSWVAMMFSAGMGIGLMFFGVAEPLSHFTSPPPGTSQANTTAAMETAMATTPVAVRLVEEAPTAHRIDA
jgi:choline-glycine betaine transporter